MNPAFPSLRRSIFFSFFLSFLFLSTTAWSEERAVDDFYSSALEGFPASWDTYPFQKGKAKKVYRIKQEGNLRFIHADDHEDISTPIFRDLPWSLRQHPYLSWKWRAITLPKGAREDGGPMNDSACAVYVAFGKTSGVALKYVWSSELPVGHVWEKQPGKFYIIVAASGVGNLNRWENEKINVVEDYKKYFKKDPTRDPSGIGLMTDGNATHTPSACDYGDFRISS